MTPQSVEAHDDMAAMASRARKPHLVWLADRMRARDSQCLWNARPAAVKLT